MKKVNSVIGAQDWITVRAAPRFLRRAAQEDELVVLTANLWHDWPLRRRLPERLEAFARLVEAEDVHLVLLQEVTRWRDLRVDEWLGNRLGMAYAFTSANGDVASIGFEEGPAILSRFPLRGAHSIPLDFASASFVRRKAVAAQVITPGGPLWASSVHLSLMAGPNRGQIQRLDEWGQERAPSAPVLIGGDFNAPESSDRMRALQSGWQDLYRQLHPSTEGSTHELRWPWGGALLRQRLDYLFLRRGHQPWRPVEARLVRPGEKPNSDHSFVLARLRR
jgi:endonuclease/exonuclease/phosphatase family metal-dependent hydrolase